MAISAISPPLPGIAAIALTLRATRGNQVRASEVLGLNRNTLRKKIRELNIPVVRGGQ